MKSCSEFMGLPEPIPNTGIEQALSSMILSHSGWRKIFSASGDEQDRRKDVSSADLRLTCIAVLSFCRFLKELQPRTKKIIVARDSRPTGISLEDAVFKTLLSLQYKIYPLGIAAAPEVFCFARQEKCSFIYISASHNPIGHNGFKFGLGTGSVLSAQDSEHLISIFKDMCSDPEAVRTAWSILVEYGINAELEGLYLKSKELKKEAFEYYFEFSKKVITASSKEDYQNNFFGIFRDASIQAEKKCAPLCILCDFNGSARANSIDRNFFEAVGIRLIGLNESVGAIRHGIVPEGDNLEVCAEAMRNLRKNGKTPAERNVFLGYMPDCDGDRGNIVYFDEETKDFEIICAQDVFALAVVAELAYLRYAGKTRKPVAIVANGPTSLRIEEIAKFFKAKVFRAEVGEANVVNLAEDVRKEGFETRIFGEGSNGGNITYPSSVRDPLNTVFAVLKILLLCNAKTKRGLFKIWLEISEQAELKAKVKGEYSLRDILKTLPQYSTTPANEERAKLKIQTADHVLLKNEYQKIFEAEWAAKSRMLKEKYGFSYYKVFALNGTKEIENPKSFGSSGKGGLKIQFYGEDDLPSAFIWMRGSGTEPVFRIMADIKGSAEAEAELLNWQREMTVSADTAVQNKLAAAQNTTANR